MFGFVLVQDLENKRLVEIDCIVNWNNDVSEMNRNENVWRFLLEVEKCLFFVLLKLIILQKRNILLEPDFDDDTVVVVVVDDAESVDDIVAVVVVVEAAVELAVDWDHSNKHLHKFLLDFAPNEHLSWHQPTLLL